MNDFLFESSFLLVSFDFFFAKEGNDLLEFVFSRSSWSSSSSSSQLEAELDLVSFLFVVRGLGRRLMMTTMEIYLYRVRENFCGLERTKERDLSSVSEYERSTQRASNVSRTYALKP